MTTQQDSVDVERLRHQLTLAAGRLHWAASAGAKNAGAAALLAKWSDETYAALTLPITQRDEQGEPSSDDERLIRSAIRDRLTRARVVVRFGLL